MRASYCNICGLFILVHACFIQCSLWVITIIFSFQVVRNFTWTLISDAVMLGRLVIMLKASFFRRQTWSFLGGKSVVCFPLLLLSSSNKKYMRIGFEFFTWKQSCIWTAPEHMNWQVMAEMFIAELVEYWVYLLEKWLPRLEFYNNT